LIFVVVIYLAYTYIEGMIGTYTPGENNQVQP